MRTISKHSPLILVLMIAASARFARADGPPASMPWLHEGLLLTFSWYTAIAPGNGSDYHEDEHGNWIDPATGQTYNRSTQQGTSGSGLSQVTVACIEGDKAIMALQPFGNAGALGNNVPVPLTGGGSFVVPIDQAGDYWISLAKLAALHTDASTGTSVTQIQWKTAKGAVNAISVQVINHDSYTLHVFDAATGLCLHFATSARGAAPKLVGPGDFGQGDVTLTHGDLLATRDPAIPWKNEPAPPWVAALKALHYRGSVASRGPLPMPQNQVTLDLTTTDRGRNWIQLDSVAAIQMQGAPQTPPTKTTQAFGPAQWGGVWIPPAAVAALQNGQVLDSDPLTKMQTTVTQVGDTITLSAKNAGGEITSTYEKSTGLLVGSSYVNALSLQLITVQLQSRE